MRLRLTIILLFLGTFAYAQVLRVRPYNRITKKAVISLSDLVSTDGLSPKTVSALQSIKLGEGPSLGAQRVLTDRTLAAAIRGNRVLRKFSFQIPHRVTIQNRGYQASESAVRQKLLAEWQPLCHKCKVIIKSLQMPVVAPKYAHDKWILEQADQIPSGHFAQKLIFVTASQEPVIYWVNGEVEIRKLVPVLTRSVEGGIRLNANDFKFEWRNVTYATDTTPNKTQMIGHQIAAMMNAGQIIWRSSLVREKAVHFGQIVRVTTGSNSWQINLQAQAQQEGFVGDYVNVRNLETNKIFSARVVGPGLVELE